MKNEDFIENKKETCKTCHYYYLNKNKEEKCRRYPPKIEYQSLYGKKPICGEYQ